MRTVAIVQARMGSIRFPNKVMRPTCHTPLIGLLLERLARAKRIDQIILATSANPCNRPLSDYVRSLGFDVYEGSDDDVLDRYYQAACDAQADIVVRITGDCPLIDPEMVNAVVLQLRDTNADYASNTSPPTYPDGLDVEAFRFSTLEKAWKEATAPAEREHVTLFMQDAARFHTVNVFHHTNFSSERWTVDEPEDLEVVARVFEHFDPKRDFSWQDVMQLRHDRPEYFSANRHLVRDEGAAIGTGPKLWKRARRVIPGGNMLLSKRPEMFLSNQWPSYFSKAKGCRVWDMDGREYIDMSIMGIGTNILGYGHAEVDEAVHRAITAGNMSSLNCPEEVYLAERLIELHPWADMVRLARSGGEANAMAIRIARAASGRDKVAICGYHGWHDWYLAANLGDEQNLAGHLLPGLAPNGVPKNLRGTVLPFRYNQFDELEILVTTHSDIGVIMMEVSRNEDPKDGFLEKVRALATERGIVLVFDECTSGFRETFGGLHKKYSVEPDMAVFGKALGNGYAITAVIGRRDVMEAAQSTFMSSTFWTERIGPVAGLKTLEVMRRVKAWETITAIGHRIRAGWQQLANRYGVKIAISGLPAVSGFAIVSPSALAYKTLITQQMLEKDYLAGTLVYACIDHEPAVLDRYFEALDPVFGAIRDCEDGQDVRTLLRGPVCHDGFKRLN